MKEAEKNRNRRTGFQEPKGYFADAKKGIDKQLSAQRNFSLPEGYLSKAKAAIDERVERKRRFSWRSLTAAASIVFLVGSLFFLLDNNSTEEATLLSQLDTNTLTEDWIDWDELGDAWVMNPDDLMATLALEEDTEPEEDSIEAYFLEEEWTDEELEYLIQ